MLESAEHVCLVPSMIPQGRNDLSHEQMMKLGTRKGKSGCLVFGGVDSGIQVCCVRILHP